MMNGDYKLLVLDEAETITKFVKKFARNSSPNKTAVDPDLSNVERTIDCVSLAIHIREIARHKTILRKQMRIKI